MLFVNNEEAINLFAIYKKEVAFESIVAFYYADSI